MEDNLISKKELLEKTNISYGQLYRWKRKNLIPEDWFIRKSTFTGQETFFPKDKILERVDQIKNMKDDLSLNDLAGMFSPSFTGIILKKETIIEQRFVSENSLRCFIKKYGDAKEFDFMKILNLYVLDKMFKSEEIDINDGNLILSVIEERYSKLPDKNYDLVFIKKKNVSICLLLSSISGYYFDSETRIINSVNLASCIEELKFKLI